MIKRLAVFCGAKPGQDPDYMKMAQAFGTEMAQHGITWSMAAVNLA